MKWYPRWPNPLECAALLAGAWLFALVLGLLAAIVFALANGIAAAT